MKNKGWASGGIVKAVIIVSIAFVLSLISMKAKADTLKKFEGTWELVKGEEGPCPQQITGKKIGKTKIKIVKVRPSATHEYEYDTTKTIERIYTTEYKKSSSKNIDVDYTLKTVLHTSVTNGSLVSGHLWSSPQTDWSSTGIKNLSVKKGRLHLDKVVMGLVNEKGNNVSSNMIKDRYFKYDNDYTLNATPFSCRYKKSKVVARK